MVKSARQLSFQLPELKIEDFKTHFIKEDK